MRRMRWTSTPTTPEPSPWRPKAAIASRAASRISPSLAVGDRLAYRLAQLVEREPVAAVVAALLSDPALQRFGFGGAKEVALEDQLEDPPVLLRLGDRRRQRLAKVVAVGPRNRLEGGERVEELRGPDRYAFRTQLLAKGGDSWAEPRR